MLEQLSGETALYPIIGDPIIFVKSPQRMTAQFEARGLNGICIPMQVPDGDLEGVVRGLQLVPNVQCLSSEEFRLDTPAASLTALGWWPPA